MKSRFTHLECGACHARHEADALQTTCTECGRPLLARYELQADDLPTLAEVLQRPPGQMRMPEVQPCRRGAETPTLGEGHTPMLPSPALATRLGVRELWIKDEAQNPTGSFKARGMAAAVARAKELGVQAVCLPSAGNAGGAACAYGAMHGIEVHVAVPRATPATIVAECEALGARVERIEGHLGDAGHWIAERAQSEGWFNLATLREPYRIEGKKMMGYELLWQLGRVPEVVIYPTGGGTGLIGMLKAFDEMQAMGWIGDERPRFVSVQTAGCAPIVRAFHAGERHATAWENPDETEAFGLRVPGALGDFLMLEGLRATNGTAVAVTEAELLQAQSQAAHATGLWMCPEGGACHAAALALKEQGWFRNEDQVVMFNTGSPLKYR